ncbi:hypothetical protein C4D60_Mb06t11920 [Musa balbisiana]|uniref:Uncharacterized protein n=1 Tax=Musa balbisiana TaxID=52838 RepID=A0A4S8INQ3_MUSBA|nr:hypothetical protein C4D60_Mb06t11920 [Musa balbisiana]
MAYRGGAEETVGFHVPLHGARVSMTEENFLGIPRGFRRRKKLPRRVYIHRASHAHVPHTVPSGPTHHSATVT